MSKLSYKNFEDYLCEQYHKVENPLDDESVDGFDHWLCNLGPDEFIIYGDKYAAIVK